MKKLWDALFDPYMGIVLPMILINLGAQIADIFAGTTINYLLLSGLITISYVGGVIVTLVFGSAGE